jgi:hypothetical protein
LSRRFVHCRHATEGDATALEAECLGRFRDWFVMLATTRMTKSFKMVLLRVLLDNDAVFSGMPIPELAAKCREFLVAHEFLRRDIADAATGQPVEMSPRKWESSWRKFPISIWMQEQEGRRVCGSVSVLPAAELCRLGLYSTSRTESPHASIACSPKTALLGYGRCGFAFRCRRRIAPRGLSQGLEVPDRVVRRQGLLRGMAHRALS